MPNWCNNNVQIKFPSAEAKAAFLKKIMSPNTHQDEAVEQALKVILTSLVGVISPAKPIPTAFTELNPNRIGKAVSGFPPMQESPTVEGEALSELFDLFVDEALLTDDVIDKIGGIFERSGASRLMFDELSEGQQEAVADIMEQIGFDFGVTPFSEKTTPQQWWDSLGKQKKNADSNKAGYLDYAMFVRRSLAEQVSGFNASIWRNYSGYNDTVSKFGVKWNSFDKWEDIATDLNETDIRFEFSSPWSAPVPVIDSIMNEFKASGSLTAYEPGCAFAIQAIFEDGAMMDYEEDELKFADPDDDDYEIVWPPYVAGLEA